MVAAMVGKKTIMAVTGLIMVLFVIVHMLGNLTIFAGFINAYANHLRGLPPLLWTFRIVMLAAVVLHVIFGIQLTLENWAAKPVKTRTTRYLKVSFAGKTMIWTGLLLMAFIVYHVLHFTARVTNPAISNFFDVAGFPDVHKMVVLNFQQGLISAVYALSMVFLFLHLSHGIQSFFQTMGWNNERTISGVQKVGMVIALTLFAGFVAVPFAATFGLLSP